MFPYHLSPGLYVEVVVVDLLRTTSGVVRFGAACGVSCSGCRSVGWAKVDLIPKCPLWPTSELEVGVWRVVVVPACLDAIVCVN